MSIVPPFAFEKFSYEEKNFLRKGKKDLPVCDSLPLIFVFSQRTFSSRCSFSQINLHIFFLTKSHFRIFLCKLVSEQWASLMLSEDFSFCNDRGWFRERYLEGEGGKNILLYSEDYPYMRKNFQCIYFPVFFFPSLSVPEFVEFPEGNREGWGRGRRGWPVS